MIVIGILEQAKNNGICYDCPPNARRKWSAGERTAYRNDTKRPICLDCAEMMVAGNKAIWRDDGTQKNDAREEAQASSSYAENSLRIIATEVRSIATELKELRRELSELRTALTGTQEPSTISPPPQEQQHSALQALEEREAEKRAAEAEALVIAGRSVADVSDQLRPLQMSPSQTGKAIYLLWQATSGDDFVRRLNTDKSAPTILEKHRAGLEAIAHELFGSRRGNVAPFMRRLSTP